jgi:hypothetical protein
VRKRHAPEVQNLLGALKAKMALKGASSESIVAAFIKQHPDVIARENLDLVNIALMKLVGHVGAARATGSSAAQLEMFSEFAVPKTVLFRLPDGSREHRQLQSLTVREGREHVLDRTKPRVRVPQRVKELARLLDTVEPFKVSGQSTIGECWTKFQKSQGGG